MLRQRLCYPRDLNNHINIHRNLYFRILSFCYVGIIHQLFFWCKGVGCVYLIFVYPSKYHNCNCILTSDLKPFIILRRSRLLNYVFRRFLRVIIDMYQGLRICFLMCVNTISLIPWYSLWMSQTSFIFKAIMYARKAHRNFYHFFKPLHICLPALLHLFLSYWCC